MKTTIIAVGKLKETYLKDGIKEYSKRISRYSNIEILEVPDKQIPDKLTPSQEQIIKKIEGDGILKRIKPGSIVIALDIIGVKLTSVELADKIKDYTISGKSHIIFIIGGSLGLDTRVLDSADLRLSLSDMTFPHQLTRMILLEQIYRNFKITSNEPYHK